MGSEAPSIWYQYSDDRVCIKSNWYAEGDNEQNTNPCVGCQEKNNNFLKHTFDAYCKVKCKSCQSKAHSIHSTYTRLHCLPGTRKTYNRTSLPDWSFNHLITYLDETSSTFKISDGIFVITGKRNPYIAKMILCSSDYEKVVFIDGLQKIHYDSTMLSKSFASVATSGTIKGAIANCQVRES